MTGLGIAWTVVAGVFMAIDLWLWFGVKRYLRAARKKAALLRAKKAELELLLAEAKLLCDSTSAQLVAQAELAKATLAFEKDVGALRDTRAGGKRPLQ